MKQKPKGLKEAWPLAPLTSWQVGGPAQFYIEPQSETELREGLEWALSESHPIHILGGGTNVLIHDQGIRGLVVGLRRFAKLEEQVSDGELRLNVLSGTAKSELLKVFLKHKLEPAVFLAGLPGDVGGGIVMNAGVGESWQPREFVELTRSIRVWDWSTGKIIERGFQRQDLRWEYRHCTGWQPGVIVSAELSWPMQPQADVLDRVRKANHVRLTKQPLDLPSCGSVFVNPPGDKAGRLIEAAGLKAFRIGGAQVSPKHANFIVNVGGATAADLESVIRHVQAQVLKQFGVQLRTEVVFLGPWA